MWRQNAFPVNSDSDQSISDEDDLNVDLGKDCISLNTNTEQGLQLQSRLEILRGLDDVSSGRKSDILSHENEDEVEIPDFPNEGGLILSHRKETKYLPGDEIISDNEDDFAVPKCSVSSIARKLHKDNSTFSFKSERPDGICTWSKMYKEAEALINFNEKSWPSCSFSRANKSCKGVRGKVKPKFSLCPKLHKDGISEQGIFKDKHVMPSKERAVHQLLEPVGEAAVGNSSLEFLEGFHRQTGNQLDTFPSEAEGHRNELIEHSMTEIFGDLQDRNDLLRASGEMSRRTRGNKAHCIVNKSISPLGDRVIDNEEQLEGIITESSSDDEDNYQNLNLTNQEMKGETMADRFQEALAATSFSNEGPLFTAAKLSGIGLFGKLQQVMQSEKERDADFLRKIQMGSIHRDESHSIVVKILSRYLDAKLIVCRCSFHNSLKDSHLPESSETLSDRTREGTIMFSSRVCSEVELEVGNLISIHRPWKEVKVMGDNKGIILCTYFSQI